jgi:undecaprenyl diphosphate synthase
MEDNLKIPVHVAIIMDGNGRWARLRGKDRIAGHTQGVRSVRTCVETALEAGVKYLSLFAFSEENWSRPQSEVNGLMDLMVKGIKQEKGNFAKNGVKLRVIGERSRLDPSIADMIDSVIDETSANTKMVLTVFLSYSGKWDILRAAKRLAEDCMAGKADPSKLTYDDFESRLSTLGLPDPDLLIRTSGEMRISNFLLWQCAYSEFYFTDVLWPDFGREDFMKALQEYARRDRRYGKVK